jgi:CheY-like chemotaxis protein
MRGVYGAHLIVDDEPNIRRMVRKYAEFYDYAVTEAADGIQAVRLCRRCASMP